MRGFIIVSICIMLFHMSLDANPMLSYLDEYEEYRGEPSFLENFFNALIYIAKALL